MNDVIVGNISSLCAMITDSVSGTRKKQSQILGIQVLSQVFYAAGSVILKGYSSTAQNLVAVLRNLAAIRGIRSRAAEWTLVALGVALGVWFNNRGLWGLLPVAANLEYSVCVFRMRENARGLKLAFMINMLMYAVFNFIIRNYVGTVSCLVVTVSTAVSLIKEKNGGQPPADSEQTAK